MKEEIEIIQKDALAAIAVADDESSLDDARAKRSLLRLRKSNQCLLKRLIKNL